MRKKLILICALAILSHGCAFMNSGTGGGFDLQSVPGFRNCGKSEEGFALREKIVLDNCTWTALSAEKTKTTDTGVKADGQFVFVELELKNNSNQDIVLTGIEVEMLDTKDALRTYDSKEHNSILEAVGRESILKGRIRGGETVRGWVAFDVSEKAKGLELRVRDIDLTSSASARINLGL